jgi:hypothetical protein
MAIYTTLFLSQPSELPDGFPGWRLPLAQPIRRETRNPFTGRVVVIETREPEWPSDAGREQGKGPQVVVTKGSYNTYLERRLPPFVRQCPHWAAKGVTEVELNPLVEAVGETGAFECALHSPPSSGALLQQFPTDVLGRLRQLSPPQVKEVATRWAAIMSDPEHIEPGSEGWSPADAMGILRPLVELARKATVDQKLYLLIET